MGEKMNREKRITCHPYKGFAALESMCWTCCYIEAGCCSTPAGEDRAASLPIISHHYTVQYSRSAVGSRGNTFFEASQRVAIVFVLLSIYLSID